jgi:hypothetical protein
MRIVSGSMVLGSDAAPTVLVADFKRAQGVLSVSDVSWTYIEGVLLLIWYSPEALAIFIKPQWT